MPKYREVLGPKRAFGTLCHHIWILGPSRFNPSRFNSKESGAIRR